MRMKKMRPSFLHHLHDYFFPHKRNRHHPHIFGATSVAVLVSLIIVCEGAYFAQTKLVFLKTDFLASVLPGVLVRLTNHDRSSIGIGGVTEDTLLNQAARAAASDMAAKGYFSHVSPDGKAPWYWLDAVGYRYSYAGQNLAVNFTDSEAVQTAWMESPTHRANIIKPQYTRVGFGTANGIYEGKETTFVVEFFAAPAEEQIVQKKELSVRQSVAAAPAPARPVQVLGAETIKSSAAKVSWLAWLSTAPLYVIMTLLMVLLAVIAASFSIAVVVRHEARHPRVLVGGMLLLVLISGALLLNMITTSTLELPSDTQAASTAL